MWVVGTHGGAGETTLTGWDESWASGEHAWPPFTDRACPVLLVARTNVRGLLSAQAFLKQWVEGGAGPNVDLLGLALIADAPGKLPKPLRDLAIVVSGGAPRTWEISWSEPVRMADPDALATSRVLTQFVTELRSLCGEVTASN